jgi:argininosuccinate lyase
MRQIGAILLVMASVMVAGGSAMAAVPHDAFYWTGEINKASTVMVVRQGIVPQALGARIAAAVTQVIAEAAVAGAKRPSDYLQIEPLITAIAGPDATRMHSGRSRQDINPTFHRQMQRERLLALAVVMNESRERILRLAAAHQATIIPAYTNGVQAQPITYGHYLLAFAAQFERHAARLREAYGRLNRSPLGAAALGTSSFPVDRVLLADLLGFEGPVENSYDAGQTSPLDQAAELAGLVSTVSIGVGAMMQDLHTQYHQTTPWIMLREGTLTGPSSIMPQKRNPYGIQNVRAAASESLAAAMAVLIEGHNVNPGMGDYKRTASEKALDSMAATLRGLNQVLESLVIDVARAQAEVDADYATTTELADTLQREADVPFRIGHHFASEIVTFGRANHLPPAALQWADIQRIWATVSPGSVIALSEKVFRRSLSARGMVEAAKGLGGPQPAEVARMLAAGEASLVADQAWLAGRVAALAAAQGRLDQAFAAVRGEK